MPKWEYLIEIVAFKVKERGEKMCGRAPCSPLSPTSGEAGDFLIANDVRGSRDASAELRAQSRARRSQRARDARRNTKAAIRRGSYRKIMAPFAAVWGRRLVELRGIEPLTSAVRLQRSPI